MNKIIICPKCGEVKKYLLLERVHRNLIFDADDNPCGATEDIVEYTGKVPRCICGKKVSVQYKGEVGTKELLPVLGLK